MPEFPPRVCVKCQHDFRPAIAGQDECIPCQIKPKAEGRAVMSVTKVCAKEGCERTFEVSPKQPRRSYCDVHFVGKKGAARDGTPKRRRVTRPRPVKPTPIIKPLYTMTGVDPKMSGRLCVTSEHLMDIEFGDDFVTFHSPGIKLLVG